MNYVTSLSSNLWVTFLFPLFLADIDKKYRNEIEMIFYLFLFIKLFFNNSVTYMEYVYL